MTTQLPSQKIKRAKEAKTAQSELQIPIKKLEQEHEVEEYRNHSVEILESITDAFYAIDTQWRFTYINKKAAEFVKGKEHGLLGKNILEAFPTLIGSNVEDNYRRVMSEQIALHFETQSNVFPEIWFEMHVYPTSDGLCVYFRDITKQRQIQQQLLEAQKLEAVGQLAGGLAHDLNNQLTIIMGYTDLRLINLTPELPFYNDFIHIKRAVEKSVNLTRQLLMFSRKQPLNKEIINLNIHLHGFQIILEQLAEDGIELQFDLAPDLWPINADSTNVDQVLTNLMVNARDSMPAGGKIIFTTENRLITEKDCERYHEINPGNYVTFTIRDNGVGIDSQVIPHIFEPFFTTKERTKGTGLGLAVVYGIVKAHEGMIEVQSQLGQGSQFKILFPAVTDEPTDKLILERPEAQISLEQYHSQGERILLIEDEMEIMTIIQQILTTHGFVVFPCRTVSEAFDTFLRENGRFELIVSDIILPDGRGTDLVLQLTQKTPKVKSLLVSGYPGERIHLKHIRQKGLPFLPKPYTVNQLLGKIYEILH